MLEKQVEARLKARLEAHGFKVLKLQTPGNAGVPDRIILRPHYSPGPPFFVECKRPGKHERRLQELVCEDLAARGCIVLQLCDSYERVDEIEALLLGFCNA